MLWPCFSQLKDATDLGASDTQISCCGILKAVP